MFRGDAGTFCHSSRSIGESGKAASIFYLPADRINEKGVNHIVYVEVNQFFSGGKPSDGAVMVALNRLPRTLRAKF